MANEIIVANPTFLAPAASVNDMLAVYQAKKDFIGSVLRQNVDYGTIAGSEKPALFKPGAEKMVSFFGLSPTFEDIVTIEDWLGESHGGEPFFYYRQRCKLYKGERLIATADGSCNSWEKKYRYRNADRICPQCGSASIFKSKNKPEYYCWSKRGGCGATYPLNDRRITDQEVGQIKNPDVPELVNTILKMAQKRAMIAAVLIGTGLSDYFTQDVEDFVSEDVTNAQFREVTSSSPSRPAATVIAELGFEPPEPPEPEPQIVYPPELAIVTNSEGIPYVSLDSEKLRHMRLGIRKELEKNGLSDDDKARYAAKSDAINQILAIRGEK